MTTWLKKLRLYLLRRQLKAVTSKWRQLTYSRHLHMKFHADLINRIAEIEKTL